MLETTALPVKMWGYPYLTWAALVAMAGLLVLMATDPSTRIQLISVAAFGAVVLAVALIRRSRAGRSAPPSGEPPAYPSELDPGGDDGAGYPPG